MRNMATDGSILVLLAVASGIAGQTFDISCPEDKLNECKDSPTMKSLWIEDACKYYDLLKTCIAQYSFDCAENAQYQKIVQDMMTQKEIFCKKEEPVCDTNKLQNCFGKYIDMQNTDLQNPETYPLLCRNYTDFNKCYAEAAAPCVQDPTFSQSPWEGLYGQVKTACLSTSDCLYYKMTGCNAMLYEGLSMVSTVPTSFFLQTTCSSSYTQFKSCMEPLLVPCVAAGSGPFPEFLMQMQSTEKFIKLICEQYEPVLRPFAESCYDKPSIQVSVDNTCTNPLMTVTFAGEPDSAKLCRQGKTYVECIRDFVAKECPGNLLAPLMLAAYHESWLLDNLSFLLGVTCVPFGYANTSKTDPETKMTTFTFHNGLIIPTTTTPSLAVKTPAPSQPPKPEPEPTTTQAPQPPPSTASAGSNSAGSNSAPAGTNPSSGSVCRMSSVVWGILVLVVAFL